MPMKSSLVIMVPPCGGRPRLWDSGGEAERPDLDLWRRAQHQAVRLVAPVLGEGAQAGGGIAGDRLPLAVDLDLELALALDRRVGAARLEVERQVLAVLAGDPGPLPGAAGEELGGGGGEADARGGAWPQRAPPVRGGPAARRA